MRDIVKIRAARNRWYNRNKAHAKDMILDRRKEIAIWLRDIKLALTCSKCPENNIACLQFHHINPDEKDITIAKVVSQGWSKERILKEINKCIVLCANCHAKEHYKVPDSVNG